MNISKKILQWVGKKIYAATYLDKDGWFVDWALGGRTTASGEQVGNDSALRISAVYSCIRCISEDIAKVPLMVYQKAGEGKEKRNEHPAYRLLHNRPNVEMSAMDFRQTLTAHAIGWGNGYAEILRDVHNKVVGLYPLCPNSVTPKRDKNGFLYYEVRSVTGQTASLWPDEVLHIKGLGYDGVVGYNIIQYARECLGAAMAVEKHGAAFFGNGARPGGVLEHPNSLSKEAQKRLIESFEERHQGASNAFRVMVAEEGMKFNQVSIPPEESQFIQTRQFTIPEICRWFRIPPHKIADLSKSAFSNIEQQSLDYVSDSLLGWYIRWEQEIWFKLFNEQERNSGYFAEHIIEGLLRGDIAARYAAYAVARNWGILNVNEIRDKENLNPVENGDQYLVPLNMTTPEKINEPVVAPPVQNVIADIAKRIDKAETTELKKHVKHSDKVEWREWLISFYKKHNKYVEKTIAPLGLNLSPENITLQKMLTESASPAEFLNFIAPLNTERIKNIIQGYTDEA